MNDRQTDEQLPFLSVVIPTKDRAEDLTQSLPDILAVDYPGFEIVVVDQSRGNATERIVRDAVESAAQKGLRWELAIADDDYVAKATGKGRATEGANRVVYRHVSTVGVSRSLNEGVRISRAESMAFTPDDATVSSNWLRRAAEVLANEPQAGMIFAAVVPEPDGGGPVGYVPTFVPEAYQSLQGTLARLRLRGVMGANMIIRRGAFDAVGGFDECLGTGCMFHSFEDADIAYRMLQAGFAVVIDPENPVVHWGEREFDDGTARRLIRNTRYGKGAFLAKHIRCGDLLAIYALMRAVFGEMSHTMSNLIRVRTLTGAGRLWYLIQGVVAGVRQPLDRRFRVFLP